MRFTILLMAAVFTSQADASFFNHVVNDVKHVGGKVADASEDLGKNVVPKVVDKTTEVSKKVGGKVVDVSVDVG